MSVMTVEKRFPNGNIWFATLGLMQIRSHINVLTVGKHLLKNPLCKDTEWSTLMTNLIDAVTVGKHSAEGQVCTDTVWVTPITSPINAPAVGKLLFDGDVSFPI